MSSSRARPGRGSNYLDDTYASAFSPRLKGMDPLDGSVMGWSGCMWRIQHPQNHAIKSRVSSGKATGARCLTELRVLDTMAESQRTFTEASVARIQTFVGAVGLCGMLPQGTHRVSPLYSTTPVSIGTVPLPHSQDGPVPLPPVLV